MILQRRGLSYVARTSHPLLITRQRSQWEAAATPRGRAGMAVKIAIANVRGGVGKSTTSMMLAEGLALKQLRVLVLDIDPQAMVSELLLRFGGLRQVVKDRRTLAHVLGRFAQGKALKLASNSYAGK